MPENSSVFICCNNCGKEIGVQDPPTDPNKLPENWILIAEEHSYEGLEMSISLYYCSQTCADKPNNYFQDMYTLSICKVRDYLNAYKG